ncbi:uncharacterized protein [Haliotis asinina]|uniref:uncharacterized protein isoform X2 n=1 Tax=Haliotis asinina TaxID=109174 RepID=UPI0035318B77
MSVLVLVFAAAYLCSSATPLTTSRTTASSVSSRRFTVCFVVDGSESIASSSFQIVKNALNGFVDSSQSIGSVVKIGVVVYGKDVTTTIAASSNVTALSTEIDKIPQPKGGTFTHLGIRRATVLLSKEPTDTALVMIVLTDGLSNYPDDTKVAASEARNSGITIFSVGVNPLLNFPNSPYKRRYETELRSIASSKETVFQTENFFGLAHTMGMINEILSSSKDGGMSEWGSWNVPLCPRLTCENPSSNRTVTRTRSCNNPPPTVAGRPCKGNMIEAERRDCHLADCDFVTESSMLISVAVAAVVGLLILVAVIAICTKRRQRQKEYNRRYNASQSLDRQFTYYNLELLTVLGEGHFGKVWKAKANGILHPGQCDIVAVKVCKDSRMLVMEYSPLGNLLQFLRKKRLKVSRSTFTPLLSNDSENQSNDDESGLTSKQLTMFAYQIAKGLRHLHRNEIIHRDVAARNVLLFDNLQCKVADFGLARHLSDADGGVYETTSQAPLPVRWMAPESLRYRIYTTKSDVWSYGILLWEIVTLGGSPYQGRTARQVVQDVLNGQTMSRPDHCAPELFSLMKRCWQQEQGSRPDCEDLSRKLDTLLEESSNYIKLLDYQDHLYMIIPGPSGSDAEEKL